MPDAQMVVVVTGFTQLCRVTIPRLDGRFGYRQPTAQILVLSSSPTAEVLVLPSSPIAEVLVLSNSSIAQFLVLANSRLSLCQSPADFVVVPDKRLRIRLRIQDQSA